MTELDEIVVDAKSRAKRRRQLYCDPEQLLEALLLKQGEPVAALPVSGFLDELPRLAFEPSVIELSRVSQACLERTTGAGDGDALLRALLSEESPIREDLRGSVADALQAAIEEPSDGGPASVAAGGTDQTTVIARTMERSDQDDILVDRPELVDRTLLTLMFGNPLLVGPVGSGRRSLVRLLLRRISEGSVPSYLEHAVLLELDPTALIAGTKYRGELEEKVQQLIHQLLAVEGKPVLVIENLPALAGDSGSTGRIDPLLSLIPHIRDSRICVLGLSTQDELREHLESRPDLHSLLVPLHMPQLTSSDTVGLLSNIPAKIKTSFDVVCSEESVALAVELAHRHVPQAALPGTSEMLLRGAAAALAYECEMLSQDDGRSAAPYWSRCGRPEFTEDSPILNERHLLVALAEQHRIPFEHLDTDVREKVDGLHRSFHETLFGQDHVLTALTATLKVALQNLSDPKRPRGRLFFVGPPGTGKTEAAKLLAAYLMGDESALVRFNMSDFSGDTSVASLLGSDKGLAGSDEGGRLTEPLRENPHRVVLLDEIEKASPKVFNLFLQILDHGRIEDKRGRVASFRHAICIFTSNVGCDDGDLFGMERDQLEERLKRVFLPEFVDRLETIVAFRGLAPEARRSICDYQLRQLRQQVETVHGMSISWGGDVLEERSRNPKGQLGARDILRWIQCEVKPAIVDAIIEVEGGSGRIELQVDKERGIVASHADIVEELVSRPASGERTQRRG